MKLSRAIIFFGLYLIFTNSNANEKSKIINKLKNIDNIQFKFTQKINTPNPPALSLPGEERIRPSSPTSTSTISLNIASSEL